MYEDQDAAAYIAERTGEPLETVIEFLEKHFGYRAWKYGNVLETHSDVPAENGESGTVYLEGAEMSLDNLTMELASLMIQWHADPRFSDASVARMIAEEVGYSISVGLVSPEVYPHVSKWSAWIANLRFAGALSGVIFNCSTH